MPRKISPDAIASLISGSVLPLSSPGYYEANKSYFTAFNNEISPTAIVRPSSVQDVSALVKELTKSDVKIAIRSGGHTPWKGASNIQDGITIDMRGLTGVHLSADEKLVTVSAGARWNSVYETLEPRGLAVSGGRVSRVGVTGLTLGGGISYFSSSQGFVCDSVTNFEIVLSSGEVVNANKVSNSDLFTILKGGGNNFGIVTKITFRTFRQEKLWGGLTAYSSNATTKLLHAFHNFVTSPSPDEHSHISVSIGWAAAMGGELGVASTYHSKPATFEGCPTSMSAFTSIQPQLNSSLRIASLLEFTDEQSNFSVDGGRNLYFTVTILTDPELLLEIRTIFLEAVERIKDAPGLAFSLVFQPITKQMLVKSVEAGPNALGLTPDNGPQINVLLNPVWVDQADDDRIIDVCLKIIEKVEKAADSRGKLSPYRFMNYSHSSQSVINGYGRKIGVLLEEASKKYDPMGFFQKNVQGGFKLGIY